jgi:hypothetical protein
LEEAVGPEWGTPELREFLKPVLHGMREMLRKRGLEDSMLVGIAGDNRPSKAAVEDLRVLLPEAKWEAHTHPFLNSLHGQNVGYLACVWQAPSVPEKGEAIKQGWRDPFLWTSFPREGVRGPGPLNETANPVRYRMILEGILTGGGRGIGRIGADFWPVLKAGSGNRKQSIVAQYPETGGNAALSIRNADEAILAPGVNGAIPTQRFEMLRASAQLCEARITIEKALSDLATKAKLPAALVETCEQLLQHRVEAMRYGGRDGWSWFVASGWQDSEAELYDLAGQISRYQ